MSDADTPSLDLAPAAAAAPVAGGYRVLARKYRPSTFADLIGQDAMVRTLSNAFESGRIPQAWILTGVRGVGKTTTARIIARGLNYELPDGSVTAPTITMPVLGVHCQAIMESRHLDVLEMDAASHNGVDDVRQINDAVRYAPVSARYKVYIFDEVHMLTPAAFNALLKTLEEPPPHAKFVFATTEIRKVPVTVLSRCQRFDLRRVEAGLLVRHLQGIAEKEQVTVEPEALALIARAAEGSVRDSLSLLDQAIAHAAGAVRAEDVRQMLGLADRARIIDLFDALMRGDVAAALTELRDQYDAGADPSVVLSDLAEFTNFVTRVKIVPALAEDLSFSEAERTRGRDFAGKLSMRVLARTWQMQLKGVSEVQAAGRPVAAAEMVLVRIAYVADLPTPDEVIRSLGDESSPAGRSQGNGRAAASSAATPSAVTSNTLAPSAPTLGTPTLSAPTPSAPTPSASAAASTPARFEAPRGAPRAAVAQSPLAKRSPQPMSAPLAQADEPAPVLTIGRFEDLIALAAEKRDLGIKAALERDVRLVQCEDGKLVIGIEPSAPRTLVQDLSKKLALWTGRRWMVAVSAEQGAPTMRAQMDAQKAELMLGVRSDPLVQAVLAKFPGAEIVGVSRREPEVVATAPLPPAEPDEGGYDGADDFR
ncbi:MAG: DNA polymerase III subunit gamma/tau [Xanthobacteraceae bacterium]